METSSFTAIDALDACWRRKFTVIVFLFATVVIVGVVTLVMPKSYKSEAKLFVRLGRENSSLDVTTGLGDAQFYAVPLNRESEINSIAEMIQTKELFGRVVDIVGAEVILEKAKYDPNALQATATESESGGVMSLLAEWGIINNVSLREKAIIKLQKKIEIKSSEKLNVIGVGYEAHDPKVAQAIVNAIVEDYRKLHAKINRSEGSFEFLESQTAASKQVLETYEDKFEEFKNETKLISVERQRQVLVDRIALLENQWMDAEALRIAAEAEVNGLKDQLSALTETHEVTLKKGAGNDAIDGMMRDLYNLEVVHEGMVSKYNSDHPLFKQTQTKLEASRKNFNERAEKMIETTFGINNVYEAVKTAIVQKQPALVALQSRVNVLKTQLEDVRVSLADFNLQEKQFLRLERDMIIQDENYKRYTRTLLQANMDTSLQESNLTNLSVYQNATLNPKPTRPNKLLNLLAALFLGSTGGVALAILLEHRERLKNGWPQLEGRRERLAVASAARQDELDLAGVN